MNEQQKKKPIRTKAQIKPEMNLEKKLALGRSIASNKEDNFVNIVVRINRLNTRAFFLSPYIDFYSIAHRVITIKGAP